MIFSICNGNDPINPLPRIEEEANTLHAPPQHTYAWYVSAGVTRGVQRDARGASRRPPAPPPHPSPEDSSDPLAALLFIPHPPPPLHPPRSRERSKLESISNPEDLISFDADQDHLINGVHAEEPRGARGGGGAQGGRRAPRRQAGRAWRRRRRHAGHRAGERAVLLGAVRDKIPGLAAAALAQAQLPGGKAAEAKGFAADKAEGAARARGIRGGEEGRDGRVRVAARGGRAAARRGEGRGGAAAERASAVVGGEVAVASTRRHFSLFLKASSYSAHLTGVRDVSCSCAGGGRRRRTSTGRRRARRRRSGRR